ncbi:MAG TPA: T9SS type A sorting domain-containing protein [Candidatus Kapabacteria bacterium]|nr:T9SS type A sorting domain-containing protein [Candidatus Kapabacteria bacterium]
MQAAANYATAQVISKFATPSSRAGSQVELPMNLVITHPGFAMDDTDLDITGVHIVYLISNPDLLNIDNNNTGLPAIRAAVSQMPAGWSVQPGSYVSKLGDTLFLTLAGPKITNADHSFGQIAFRVMLPKLDSTTNVTLDSLEFFSDGSTSGCITPVIEDSNFSLILECGDPTLRGFMQGKGIVEYIRDASPNPVTGSTVTFNYGNQTATNLTLTIYDVLGHAVARPVDNIYHEAGSWQVSCNVARLPSGTYTYRLSADGAADQTVISKQFVIQR